MLGPSIHVFLLNTLCSNHWGYKWDYSREQCSYPTAKWQLLIQPHNHLSTMLWRSFKQTVQATSSGPCKPDCRYHVLLFNNLQWEQCNTSRWFLQRDILYNSRYHNPYTPNNRYNYIFKSAWTESCIPHKQQRKDMHSVIVTWEIRHLLYSLVSAAVPNAWMAKSNSEMPPGCLPPITQ